MAAAFAILLALIGHLIIGVLFHSLFTSAGVPWREIFGAGSSFVAKLGEGASAFLAKLSHWAAKTLFGTGVLLLLLMFSLAVGWRPFSLFLVAGISVAGLALYLALLPAILLAESVSPVARLAKLLFQRIARTAFYLFAPLPLFAFIPRHAHAGTILAMGGMALK